MSDTVDCVVVGAGPAGLAAGRALAERGVDHVLLEAGRVGETWRTQRWDAFRLNTPGWMNRMLGEQPADAYLSGGEVVQRLDALAASLPVRCGVRVERLVTGETEHLLHTGDATLRARAVVVATGAENVPRIPALAQAMPDHVVQLHTASYRAPQSIPDGAVLVVGSAQSGCQIAADLLAAGRRVYLATSAVGRAPIPYRGRHFMEWLAELEFFDRRAADLEDPSAMRLPNPVMAPGGHGMSLQALSRCGATLLGRPVAVDGDRIDFDDSAGANIALADDFVRRARAMVDGVIDRRGLDAPPAAPDPVDVPVDLNPPTTLDVRRDEIGGVVWCTGFTGDDSWLDPVLLDASGQLITDGAAASEPGVWYVGRRWLPRHASGLLHGFPGDADAIAAAVEHRLASGR